MDIVRQSLRDNIEQVIEHVAIDIVVLGAKREWSMEDNFSTTEDIAGLGELVPMPAAVDASEAWIAFCRAAAEEIGLGPEDLGYADEVEDEDEDE